MNNPIISPWVIYAINAIDTILGLLLATIIIVGAGLVVGTILYLMWRFDCYYENNQNDITLNKKIKFYLKRGSIALIICILLYSKITSKETMYTMVAMKYVTVKNINGGVETVKSAVDYIFEKIEELNSSEGGNE